MSKAPRRWVIKHEPHVSGGISYGETTILIEMPKLHWYQRFRLWLEERFT